jgi:hypothetical protein
MKWLYGFVLLTVTMPVLAQEPAEPAPSKILVRPMAAPSPALKYRFVPGLSEQTPGNAVVMYYRAFSPEWMAYRREKGYDEKMERLRQLPLAELKTTAEARFVEKMPALREVERGARRTYCDWELGPRIAEEGIGLLLPDVQSMREFARLLVLRARLEIADGKFAAAIETLKSGFTLGRHISQAGTLIHALVGIAVCTQMLDVSEELLQQPGAPNLYWALTDLSTPLIDARSGFEGEREFLIASMPVLRELRKGLMTMEQINKVKQQLQQGLGSELAGNKSVDTLFAWTFVGYTQAKANLLAGGYAEADIKAMPTAQVVLLNELELYERHRDNMFKWFHFPYHIAAPRLEEVEKQLQAERNSVQGVLARLLLPAVAKVLLAQVRLERRVAALRTIEAVRLHAAQTGQLPATLADIKVVPVPTDPMLGQPFGYRLEGGTAYLTGAAPPAHKQPTAKLSYTLIGAGK